MNVAILVPVVGALGMFCAFLIYGWLNKQPPGSAKMVELAKAIQEGAMAFLWAEYKILSIFIVVVYGVLTWFLNWQTGVAYLLGAACSIAAGYLGMNAAVRANCRTTPAANEGGQDKALVVASSAAPSWDSPSPASASSASASSSSGSLESTSR
jgi:K(+)-stimulated pyrophosphate-energized sodium pump